MFGSGAVAAGTMSPAKKIVPRPRHLAHVS